MNDTPNYSKETEMALISACLVDNSILDHIPTAPDHFFNTSLRMIFRTMREMRSQGKAIDFITLPDVLRSKDELHQVGGAAGLAKLIEYSGPTYNYGTYAERLAEMYDARQLRDIANDMVQRSIGGDDPEQIVTDISQRIAAIGRRGQGAVHISQWHFNTKRTISDRVDNPSGGFYLRSGFSDLDKLIGPVYPDEGTLIFLVADAGFGKTILMMDIARNWSRQMPGAIYEQEMSPFRMMVRDYATRTDLRSSDIKAGKIDMAALDKLDGYYGSLNMFVCEGVQTVGSLRSDLMRLKEEYQIGWYCLDYLSLMDAKIGGEEYQRQAHISRELMRINRELGLASIVIHTPNKSQDIGGAQSIKHDTDVTLFLEELAPADEAKMEVFSIRNAAKWRLRKVRVAKNRDGEGGLGHIYLALLNNKPHFVQPGRED